MQISELWQLYNEQGQPLAGNGATKAEAFSQGLLHAASHVWIWRQAASGPEVLLQKRASTKMTWPDRYDISAAGHIDLGELPLTAAMREAKEEINLDIDPSSLYLFAVHRARLRAGEAIENEFQWLYLLELPSATDLTMQAAEVASVTWKPLDDFTAEVRKDTDAYVPHGTLYYDTVIAAINRAATNADHS